METGRPRTWHTSELNKAPIERGEGESEKARAKEGAFPNSDTSRRSVWTRKSIITPKKHPPSRASKEERGKVKYASNQSPGRRSRAAEKHIPRVYLRRDMQ